MIRATIAHLTGVTRDLNSMKAELGKARREAATLRAELAEHRQVLRQCAKASTPAEYRAADRAAFRLLLEPPRTPQ